MNNSIGDAGITALCDALSRGSKERLHSRHSRPMEALPSRVVGLALPALQFMDLRTNKIGKKGAACLADAVAEGNLPTGGLDLEGNSREAVKELEELQKTPPQRSTTTLSGVSDTSDKPDAAVPSPTPVEVLSLTTPHSVAVRNGSARSRCVAVAVAKTETPLARSKGECLPRRMQARDSELGLEQPCPSCARNSRDQVPGHVRV